MTTGQLTEPQAMRLAPMMLAGGWSVYGIRDYFDRRGLNRSWHTVKRWAKPEFAEQDREACRQRMREACARQSGGRIAGQGRNTPQFKLERASALRAAGLSFAAVATVMDFDYRDGISPEQWRYALERDVMPMVFRSVA